MKYQTLRRDNFHLSLDSLLLVYILKYVSIVQFQQIGFTKVSVSFSIFFFFTLVCIESRVMYRNRSFDPAQEAFRTKYLT